MIVLMLFDLYSFLIYLKLIPVRYYNHRIGIHLIPFYFYCFLQVRYLKLIQMYYLKIAPKEIYKFGHFLFNSIQSNKKYSKTRVFAFFLTTAYQRNITQNITLKCNAKNITSKTDANAVQNAVSKENSKQYGHHYEGERERTLCDRDRSRN